MTTIQKILDKNPKDAQALRDAALGVHLMKKGKEWSASTFSEVEGGAELEWSHVAGYESPRRAVLHAIRAGVEKRMAAAFLLTQEKKNGTA